MDRDVYALNVGITRYLRAQGLIEEKTDTGVPEFCGNLTLHHPTPDYYGAESVEHLSRLVYRMTGELIGEDKQAYLSRFAIDKGIKPFYPPPSIWLRTKKRGRRVQNIYMGQAPHARGGRQPDSVDKEAGNKTTTQGHNGRYPATEND